MTFLKVMRYYLFYNYKIMIETKKVRWGIELDIICDKCWKGDSYDWDDFK